MHTIGTLDQGRQNNFDAIRFIAATFVILCHSYGLLHQYDLLARLTGFLDFGSLAVDVFFIISGYLVTKSLMRRSLSDFVQARALRLMPGLIVAVLVCALVMGPLVTTLSTRSYYASQAVQDFILHQVNILRHHYGPLPLPGVFSANPLQVVDGSLWTLSWETWCYVRFFLIGLAAFILSKKLSPIACIKVVLTVLAVYYTVRMAVFEGGNFEGTDSLRFIGNFLTGALAYVYRDKIRLHPLFAIALIGLCGIAYGHHGFIPLLRVAMGYSVFLLAFHPAIRLHRFGKYGDFSYGLYIYAFPIQQLIIWRYPGITPALLFPFALVLTLPMAVLSWKWVEKPALELKGRFMLKRASLPEVMTQPHP